MRRRNNIIVAVTIVINVAIPIAMAKRDSLNVGILSAGVLGGVVGGSIVVGSPAEIVDVVLTVVVFIGVEVGVIVVVDVDVCDGVGGVVVVVGTGVTALTP